MTTPDKAPAKPAKVSKNRRKSRELVLKGIYQLFLNQKELRLIIRELADEPEFDNADEDYFRQLIEGVYAQLPELDRRLVTYLDRPINASIPYHVAINEGVELAKSYGGTDGHKYVNGVLDKLAAEVRPNEARRPAR